MIITPNRLNLLISSPSLRNEIESLVDEMRAGKVDWRKLAALQKEKALNRKLVLVVEGKAKHVR